MVFLSTFLISVRFLTSSSVLKVGQIEILKRGDTTQEEPQLFRLRSQAKWFSGDSDVKRPCIAAPGVTTRWR